MSKGLTPKKKKVVVNMTAALIKRRRAPPASFLAALGLHLTSLLAALTAAAATSPTGAGLPVLKGRHTAPIRRLKMRELQNTFDQGQDEDDEDEETKKSKTMKGSGSATAKGSGSATAKGGSATAKGGSATKESRGAGSAKSGKDSREACWDTSDRDACCANLSPPGQVWRSDALDPRCMCDTTQCCMDLETRNMRQLCCLNHLTGYVWFDGDCVARSAAGPSGEGEDLIEWWVREDDEGGGEGLEFTIEADNVKENEEDIKSALVIFFRSCELEYSDIIDVSEPSITDAGGEGDVPPPGTTRGTRNGSNSGQRCRNNSGFCQSNRWFCARYGVGSCGRRKRDLQEGSPECNLEDTMGATKFLLDADLIEPYLTSGI